VQELGEIYLQTTQCSINSGSLFTLPPWCQHNRHKFEKVEWILWKSAFAANEPFTWSDAMLGLEGSGTFKVYDSSTSNSSCEQPKKSQPGWCMNSIDQDCRYLIFVN
jgi:hypothetical protein